MSGLLSRLTRRRVTRARFFGVLFVGLMVVIVSPPEALAQSCVPTSSLPGLVAWWPGDGDAKEIIGNTTGTVVGSVTYGTLAQGKVGQAFSFSGSGQVVPASALSLGAFTIDAWVWVTPGKLTNPANKYRTIYADNKKGFWLHDGKIVWWAGNKSWLANTAITTGAWHHIALTYDGDKFKAYVNGQLDSQSVSIPGQSLPIGAGLGIGGHYSAEDFHGLIDEVAIFNRALSLCEIQSIYIAGGAGKCKPTAP